MTDEILRDIRILKLAEMYERAYEAFVHEMADRYVHEPSVRTKLAALAASASEHARSIAAEMDRLSAILGNAEPKSIERAALHDILEVERAARTFYLRSIDTVHDAKLADLFRALARDEAANVRTAEDALAMSGDLARRVRVGEQSEPVLRTLAQEAPRDDLSAM